MKKSKLIFCILIFVFNYNVNAQNLLDKLDKEFPKETMYEIATFKTTRIGLGHSIETRKKGALEISVFNRFWNHKEGTTQRFLADEISTRFGLDYAVTNNFTLGVGYTNFDKISDGFLKYKILRQEQNNKKRPISLVMLQGISHRNNGATYNSSYGTYNKTTSIYSYTTQLLIARKFNSKFSGQITPTLILRNKSILQNQPNSQYALGLGARYKVGGHVSIVSEYYHVFNPVKYGKTFNPFMLGVNWELSHLLLQFQITNARNFAEDAFITQTQNNFNFHDGNFHFGFNATFVLHLNKNKL